MGNLLYYAIVLIVIALVAGFLGFGGVAGVALSGAHLLVTVVVALLVIGAIVMVVRRA